MKDGIFSIRDCISVFAKRKNDSSYILSFLFQSSRIVVSFETSPLTFECIKLFDGHHSLESISAKLRVSRKELDNLVRYLKTEKILTEKGRRSREEGRYSRQVNFFASFEKVGIRRNNYQV